jgi:hypothetical protein
VREFFSRTLSYHDAIASALTHSFELGYQKGQPPLWEWLLFGAQQLVGVGIESHLLVRYGVLAAIGVGLYRASVAASGSIRWSAAISFSVVLSYQLGWRSFEGGTQALVLAAACLFTLDAVLRHVQHASWKSALYLGLAIGAGLLSKFSFALFMLALIIALCLQPAARRGLLSAWTLLALGVALLVVSPYAYWFLHHSVDIGDVVQQRLVRSERSYLVRVGTGVKNLFANTPAYLAPWFIIVGVLWWGGRKQGASSEVERPAESVLRNTTLIAFGITLAGILAVGITHFTVPYLHFILIPLFPYAAALLARTVPAAGANVLAAISLGAMVILTLARIVSLAGGSFSEDRSSGPHFPYAGLARILEERGLGDGTVVTFAARDAGNLHAFLPRAEVLWNGSSVRTALPRVVAARRSCAALWLDHDPDDDDLGRTRSRQPRALAGKPGEAIEVPWQALWQRSEQAVRWNLVRLDPEDPLCRQG